MMPLRRGWSGIDADVGWRGSGSANGRRGGWHYCAGGRRPVPGAGVAVVACPGGFVDVDERSRVGWR